MPLSKLGRRNRSCSFDMTRSKLRREDFSLSEMPTNRTIIPSALGDFAEQGTRRLMVRCDCGYIDAMMEETARSHNLELFSHYSKDGFDTDA